MSSRSAASSEGVGMSSTLFRERPTARPTSEGQASKSEDSAGPSRSSATRHTATCTMQASASKGSTRSGRANPPSAVTNSSEKFQREASLALTSPKW
jgi:hypothetical protein